MKALEDQYEGQRINAFDSVKVKNESEDLRRTRMHWIIKVRLRELILFCSAETLDI